MSEWLENIKVGDEVGFRWGGLGATRRISIHTVVKVTKTQIVTDKGGRYSRKDGYEIGSKNERFGLRVKILPVDKALRQEQEELKLREWLAYISHKEDRVTAWQLREMYKAFKAAEVPKDADS